MKFKIRRVPLLGLLAVSGLSLACAGGGFEGTYNLKSVSYGFANSAMLAPGNDSRVNLMFLLADKGGMSSAGLAYPDTAFDWNDNGRVFLDWRMLRAALYKSPKPDYSAETPPYEGSRCAGYAAGTAAFTAAMAANRGLPAAERTALADARVAAEAVCKSASSWERQYGRDKGTPIAQTAQWPAVASPAGREFLGYLQATDAFYAERFAAASAGFSGLTKASDPFVRETSAYMVARAELAAAQVPAYSDYGSFEVEKVDRMAARRGIRALNAYLEAWPAGLYTASATGLQRRGLWLAGDLAALGKTYAGLLDTAAPQKDTAASLVEEIDTKLPYRTDPALAGGSPLLLAMNDLIAMRDASDREGEARPGISAADLAAQAPLFSGQPELFSFLRATHAYYYAKDYRRVLQLIPDDAKRPAYSNLAFSRQMLRGMALASLKDRNEAGFWQQLIGGAKGLWQRPLVELALALNWERSGRLDAVFAPGSPITEPGLRTILIDNSAPAPLLRRIAQQPGLAAEERDHALYTLLSNELGRGLFAPFVSDTAIPLVGDKPSAAVFTKGKFGDGSYPCAPLTVSVRALMAKPDDAPALLCLGEFFRLHGQGDAGWEPPAPKADELGGYARGFTGRLLGRGEFYSKVIANPAARPEDKAYALYRAVMCYAPSGVSECGAEVPKSQRKAWFDQLRSQYPNSPWTKKLRYYW